MAFAIQYRRRATQQLYALKEVRVHGRFRVVVSLQLHTIQILVGIHGAGGRETTNRNHIVSCRGAARCENAWGVGQGLFNRPRLFHVHLFTSHNRNRLRGFLNGCIGFRRRCSAFCRNRRSRTPGTFLCSRCGSHGDGFFFLGGFSGLCISRHAGNRCGYDGCDFTQRRVNWLSSIGKRHDGSLMKKVNDNVNENYYYDRRIICETLTA